MKHLPIYVLAGAVLGLAIGFYHPSLATGIAPVGEVYVRLMEVVVLPYLMSSLVLGLGSLSRGTAGKLFEKSWIIYLGLWGISFAAIYTGAMTVPRVDQPAVVDFAATAGSPQHHMRLVDLLIPDNLFEALNNNYIPSIVLIGIVFGVAIQNIEKRDEFLEVLTVIRTACIRIWGWIVYLAPLGVCALLAGAVSGTDKDIFAAMSVYVAVVFLAGLFLSLWLLPMVMTCFLPLRYGEVLSVLRGPLLIGIVTSLSVAALPLIQREIERISRDKLGDDQTDVRKEIIQTSLSVSYPLAQIGNFFILTFLCYASFYFFIPITDMGLIELPFVTLLSGIGSPTSSIGAVSFMADWLGLPASTTELYVATMTATRYVQVMASVAAFAFVTFLVTFNFYGKLTFRPGRLAGTVVLGVLALAAVWSAGRWGGAHIPLHSSNSYLVMKLPEELQARSDANSVASVQAAEAAPVAAPKASESVLDRIQITGKLKVGFNPHVRPFAYENVDQRYVGFDIELVYRFARYMNVRIELVPYEWQAVEDDLIKRRFDIAVGGLYISHDRLEDLKVSAPYYESLVALIVRDERIGEFSSHAKINEIKGLKLAVFDDPILIPLARRLFPEAEVIVVKDYDDLPKNQTVDAALWTLEQARAWAISRNGFSAVVPNGIASRFLFGYLMPPQAEELADYLDYWLRMQRENGVLSDMTTRWIDPAAKTYSQ